MSEAQRDAIGCNNSKVHRDCMISDENTTVEAIRRDGSKVSVIQDGAWAGSFANPV
jgi:leucyl aminopeptidase (aminopeptidase T)